MPTPSSSGQETPQSTWLGILCLIGLDYFSSLAYQPSIAFEAAGYLAPMATLVVVLLTLFAALPIYLYVAGRSPHGRSAIGLLERSLPGWFGKILIVTLLGFAATDFVVTRTLSVADAAEHLIHNPDPQWQQALTSMGTADAHVQGWLHSPLGDRILKYWNRQLIVTIVLSLLGFIFWAMFRRGVRRHVIRLAVVAVVLYLMLNTVVIVSGLQYLLEHPQLIDHWWNQLADGRWHPEQSPLPPGAWIRLFFIALLVFPKVSLGLSGFELSMVVMPLVKGAAGESDDEPKARVRNARKLLILAALVMSIYLLGSAVVTTLLIPSPEFTASGKAANRALAYLAHGGRLADGNRDGLGPPFGLPFGTLYDLSTIIVLCLAGVSVALGLREFVPQYLHRLGMELEWAHNIGAILYLFNAINLFVTVLFQASVSAQRGAYATSVLTLISSAGVAVVLDLRQRADNVGRRTLSRFFLLLTLVFGASAIAAIVSNPAGLLISLCFIVAILVTSLISRLFRSTELRFSGFDYKDSQSQFLWASLKFLEFPVLVPHRPGRRSLEEKERRIRERHRLAPDIPVVFIEIELDDASNFFHRPVLEVRDEGGRFVLNVSHCASIPHVIAAAALELSKSGKPPEIHCGWSDKSPVEANLNFLLFGQGNIPWMVHDLIRRAEPDPQRRPRVVIG